MLMESFRQDEFMEKLSRKKVKDLVIRIRQGLGEDEERNKWIEQIRDSVPNREVIKAIMSGPNADIEDILDKLYTSNVIQL